MPYTVFYHGAGKVFLGRAHGAVMLLEQAGAEYAWAPKEEAPEGIGFVVPMVTLRSGLTIGQQGAICASLAKELGFSPDNPEGEAAALCMIENTSDLSSESIFSFSGPKPDERLVKWLGTYERALAKSGSGFLVGDSMTYADLGSYKVLEPLENLMGDFKFLPKWLAMMAESKGAKGVAALGVPMLPPKQ